jgi:SAM-dependent methyltransferase
MEQSILEGHYARKQIGCKDWLISWSHRRRFQVGLKLARQVAAERILDYGCGDGTFLALFIDSEPGVIKAVGCELEERVVEDCRARLEGRSGLSFILVDELDSPEHVSAYDLVVCMEVLEHVVDVNAVLNRLDRLLAPFGVLLISVPVETGLPLLIKQAIRKIAGWRGLGDYPGTSPYTLREYWASIFAGRRQHIRRPVYKAEDGSLFYDHKGFNWMVLRDLLAQRFEVIKTVGSPLTWLPPQLASQVCFLARKKS